MNGKESDRLAECEKRIRNLEYWISRALPGHDFLHYYKQIPGGTQDILASTYEAFLHTITPRTAEDLKEYERSLKAELAGVILLQKLSPLLQEVATASKPKTEAADSDAAIRRS